jgi:hypothetical protein
MEEKNSNRIKEKKREKRRELMYIYMYFTLHGEI